MAAENEYSDMLQVDHVQNCDMVWKRSFVFTLVANILALCTLLGLQIYSQVKPSSFVPGDPDSVLLSDDLCIPCQQETALFDYRVQTDTGKYLCCYNNTDIQRAVKIMLKEEERYNRYTESNDEQNYKPKGDTEGLTWWKNRPSAAHLHLDNSENSTKWTIDPNFVTSFKSDDIKVNGTKIEVSERGMYFIYSTISVEFSKMSQRQLNKGHTLYHNILKGNVHLPKTGPEIQMMRKYGGIPEHETDRLYTSFLCGTLFLQEGDILSSKFNEPPLIYKFPYANYFGIFKL